MYKLRPCNLPDQFGYMVDLIYENIKDLSQLKVKNKNNKTFMGSVQIESHTSGRHFCFCSYFCMLILNVWGVTSQLCEV